MPFIVRELQSHISVDPLVNGKKQEMQALASLRSPLDKCLLVPMSKQWTDLVFPSLRIYSIYNWKVPFILLWVGILKGPLELIED